MKLMYILPLLLTLSGCSLIPNPGEAPKKFVLDPLPKQEMSKPQMWQLVVDLPSVYPPLDNQRVALIPKGHVIDYYADMEWADRLGNLVQDTVVYSLQNTSAFKATSRSMDGFIPDYAIKMDVRQFWVDQKTVPAKAVVEYYVQLIRVNDRSVVAAKSIQRSHQIASLETDTIVRGMNQSNKEALQELVNFVDQYT